MKTAEQKLEKTPRTYKFC